MKQPRPCEVYKDGEHIGHFDRLIDAALATGDNTSTIRLILEGKSKVSRKGYFYSDKPMTKEELENIPQNEETNRRKPYESNAEDCEFYIEHSKEGKKQQLKQYIASHLNSYWMQIPKKQAQLEIRFLRQLINAI